MNLFDIGIIFFILLAGVAGFKRGFIKETVSVLGNVIILVLAFYLMKPVANIMYGFLPFFSLGFLGISLSALNILVYQIISFALCYLLLSVLLRCILMLTNVVDMILKVLIILELPSKILGLIAGFISGYITVFIILIILSVPLANSNYFHESKFSDNIINNTILLSDVSKPISRCTTDIYELSNKINNDNDRVKNSNKYNLQILDILMKYDVIDYDTVGKLTTSGKLSDIKNINSVTDKYKR